MGYQPGLLGKFDDETVCIILSMILYQSIYIHQLYRFYFSFSCKWGIDHVSLHLISCKFSNHRNSAMTLVIDMLNQLQPIATASWNIINLYMIGQFSETYRWWFFFGFHSSVCMDRNSCKLSSFSVCTCCSFNVQSINLIFWKIIFTFLISNQTLSNFIITQLNAIYLY